MKCFGKFGTWKVSKTEGRKRNDSDVILLRTWKNRFGELCERATHTNTILAHTHWFSMESAIVSTVFFPFFSHSALAYTCIQFNHTCMDMNVLPSFHSRTRIPVQFFIKIYPSISFTFTAHFICVLSFCPLVSSYTNVWR